MFLTLMDKLSCDVSVWGKDSQSLKSHFKLEWGRRGIMEGAINRRTVDFNHVTPNIHNKTQYNTNDAIDNITHAQHKINLPSLRQHTIFTSISFHSGQKNEYKFFCLVQNCCFDLFSSCFDKNLLPV